MAQVEQEDLGIKKYLLGFELGWWLLALLMTLLVLLPISRVVHHFPFYTINAIFILTSFILFKHGFLMRYSFFGRYQKWKIALFFLCIPFTFKLVEYLNLFITYLDENTLDGLFSVVTLSSRERWTKYIYTEMVFFGTAAIVCTVMFAFRLLISVWRVRNRGKV